MNRWLPVIGGVCMNLALGSLYAWSVFVLPLEKEFGWTRAQTSWVCTIAIVVFAAAFVLAGRIQDKRGPRICAAMLLAATCAICSVGKPVFGMPTGVGVCQGTSTAAAMPTASSCDANRPTHPDMAFSVPT